MISEVALREIRRRLIALGREHPAVAADALELLQLLDYLDEAGDRVSSPPVERPGGAGRAGKASRNVAKEYSRVKKRGEWMLREQREGSRQPFFVPERIYDAAAEAVAASGTSGADAVTLLRELERSSGEQVPDYLLRTCIRFWRSQETRLVLKHGIRYRARDAATFVVSARQAFQGLPRVSADPRPS